MQKAEYQDTKRTYEQIGSTLTGNYQIPKCLSYVNAIGGSDPLPLSIKGWFGGKRYDFVDCQVTGLAVSVQTSTSKQGKAESEIGTSSSIVVPAPGVVSIRTSPLSRSIVWATTSSPIPRPETFVTERLVLMPGRRIRRRASSAPSAAASSSV